MLLTYVGKSRELFKTLYFTPVILASVAVAKIWSKFFSVDPDGVINSLLQFVGLGSLKTRLAGQRGDLPGKRVPGGKLLAYGLVHGDYLFRPHHDFRGCAGIRRNGWRFRLENVLEDQAALMSEVFVVALVMVVNGCLKAFDIIFISTSGGPGYSSELVATYMYIKWRLPALNTATAAQSPCSWWWKA